MIAPVGASWTSTTMLLITNTSSSIPRSGTTNRSPGSGFHARPATRSRLASSSAITGSTAIPADDLEQPLDRFLDRYLLGRAGAAITQLHGSSEQTLADDQDARDADQFGVLELDPGRDLGPVVVEHPDPGG